MSLLLTSLLALTLQGPLDVLQPGPDTGYGLAVAVSSDGREVLQARGPELVRLDFEALRQQALEPAEDFDVGQLVRQRVGLDTPIRAMRDLPGGRVLVAGGDGGLLLVGRDGDVAPLAPAPDGRWCVDLDVRGERLVVLWSGWDDSLLRSYDLSTLTARATHDGDGAFTHLSEAGLRSRAAGGDLRHAAAGFACRLGPGAVFLAMGGSGVVRVPLAGDGRLGTPEQGPVLHPADRATRPERTRFRARDLAVAGGSVFVAADEAGLVELPATALTPRTPYRRYGRDPGPAHPRTSAAHLRGPGYRDHAVRVEATLHADGSTTVAVGTLPTTSAEVEWGPYRSYTTFDWRLRRPEVRRDPTMTGADVRLRLYGRGPSADPEAPPARLDLVADHEVRDLPQVWAGLALHAEGGPREPVWIVDHALKTWRFDPAPATLIQVPPATFADDLPLFTLYTTAVTSLVDSGVLLSAIDGWESLPHLRVTGAYPDVALEPIPGSEGLRLPLFVQGSWLHPGGPAGEEWLVAGNESPWLLYRVRHRSGSLEATRWQLPFDVAGDAACGFDGGRGRSYAAAAIDPAGDLIALSRSAVDHGVSLYERSALVRAALVTEREVPAEGVREPRLPEPEPAPLHLDTNPEAACAADGSYTFRTAVFAWSAGTGESVLGVAAGSVLDPASPWHQHPKLTLHRLGDCADLRGDCAASRSPDATNTAVLVGSSPAAMAFAFTVADLGETQLAFVVDTAGGLSAFDLGAAFQGPADEPFGLVEEVARWELPPSKLDGLGAPLTDVVARWEQVDGERALHLYVAASRWGVARLRVDAGVGDLSGQPTIRLVERIPTPMQASGLTLASDPVSGRPLLFVCDHDGTMVRVYTAAE